jgi:peroxiredoxin
MRRAAALSLAAVLAVSGCTAGNDAVAARNGGDNGFQQVQTGTKLYPAGTRATAPDVTGTLLDGTAYDLAADRGHVVVMNYWGSWCAPCRAEAADLQSVYADLRSKGVRFIGVNIRDEDESAARDFVAAKKITYPSLYDPAGRVALKFRDVPPQAIPSTIVIDATGKIAALHIGPIDRDELLDMIDKVGA